MIRKLDSLTIFKKEVFLLVHLFFCYQVVTFSQATSGVSTSLDEKYFEALHYKIENWPLLDVDTLAIDQKAYGYYINAFSACLVQFYENNMVAEEATQKAIAYIEKGSSDATNSYYLAELYLLKSFLLASNGQNISAFLAFRSAYKLNETHSKSYKNDINIKKTNALINAILGSVPNQFQWVLGIFGFSGDYDAGVKQLWKIARADVRVSLEAELIVLLLEQYVQNKSGLERLKELSRNHPESETIQLIFNASALKNNQSALITANKSTSRLPLILLQLGEAHLNALKPETAITYYKKYEQISEKPMTAADQYKWWTAQLLLDNTYEVEVLRNKILNNKSIITEADQYALHEARNNNTVKQLLKIRLATDGGFFSLAAQQIDIANKTLPKSAGNMAELAYRIGRLAQLQADNANAMLSFKKVLEYNLSPAPYYIPNSAYQLGEIYNAQSQPDSAILYYKKCLQYKDYPYEGSIRKKATMRLREVEQ